MLVNPLQDAEGRSENSANGARCHTSGSSVAADDAGHLMQNRAAKGTPSSSKAAIETFRPYATDLSLQVWGNRCSTKRRASKQHHVWYILPILHPGVAALCL